MLEKEDEDKHGDKGKKMMKIKMMMRMKMNLFWYNLG